MKAMKATMNNTWCKCIIHQEKQWTMWETMRCWSRQLDAFHCLACQKRNMFSLGHCCFPHSTGWFSVACCPSGSCSCGSWRTRVVTSRAQSVSICCSSFAYKTCAMDSASFCSFLWVLQLWQLKDHEQLMAVWGIICIGIGIPGYSDTVQKPFWTGVCASSFLFPSTWTICGMLRCTKNGGKDIVTELLINLYRISSTKAPHVAENPLSDWLPDKSWVWSPCRFIDFMAWNTLGVKRTRTLESVRPWSWNSWSWRALRTLRPSLKFRNRWNLQAINMQLYIATK